MKVISVFIIRIVETYTDIANLKERKRQTVKSFHKQKMEICDKMISIYVSMKCSYEISRNRLAFPDELRMREKTGKSKSSDKTEITKRKKKRKINS